MHCYKVCCINYYTALASFHSQNDQRPEVYITCSHIGNLRNKNNWLPSFFQQLFEKFLLVDNCFPIKQRQSDRKQIQTDIYNALSFIYLSSDLQFLINGLQPEFGETKMLAIVHDPKRHKMP